MMVQPTPHGEGDDQPNFPLSKLQKILGPTLGEEERKRCLHVLQKYPKLFAIDYG